MNEMSDLHKLLKAMDAAKKAYAGMELTYFDVIELKGEIDSLKEYIAELEAAQRWIPVSERLPELDQDVMAIVEGDIDKGHFYESFDGEIYFSSDVGGAMLVATHWMDIPDLPEEV